MTDTPDDELAAGLPAEPPEADAYAEGADDGSMGLTDEDLAEILGIPVAAPEPAPEPVAAEPAPAPKKRAGRPRKATEAAPEAAPETAVAAPAEAVPEVLEGLVVGVDIPASTLLEMEVGRRSLAAKAG
jgi:hypothetical protein